jgi:hypothetical protein
LLIGEWPDIYHLIPSPSVWNRNPVATRAANTFRNIPERALPLIMNAMIVIIIISPIVAYHGKRRSKILAL